jgi:hypothetical protein
MNPMRKEIVSSLVCMLMILSALPALAASTHSAADGSAVVSQPVQSAGKGGWFTQWSHDYGGNGHAQMANPVGDLDGDGINEVVIGGYENQGTIRIISYVDGAYQEEYSYSPSGGSYNCPSGCTIVDLDGDGTLELVVSWAYTNNDGAYAYHWDGTTMTTLDEYHGTGVDFLFDVNSCDYNGDGNQEVILDNAPNYGGYTLTGLQWIGGEFVYQASWTCPGGYNENPMCRCGDVDNDGAIEIVANVAEAGTWALSWNDATESWDAVAVWTDYSGSGAYGCGIADVDGDGTPEIGVGMRYTPTGYMFEWDGSTFQKVWERNMPGGAEDIIEAVDMGDADNDGQNELCIGGGPTHVIGWDGSKYVFEANLTQSTGREAGMNIGDFDTDGENELKACEILSSTGYEYIFKCDNTPPVTTIALNGTMDGDVYISDVTVSFTTIPSGCTTHYKLNDGSWMIYQQPVKVTDNGTYTVSYYSVDQAGNQEAPQNATFTISHHPLLELTLKGGVGISMKITNAGITDQTSILWKLSTNGGMILVGGEKSGTIPTLASGDSVTEKMLIIGFGKTSVTARAGSYTIQKSATIFLAFVLGLK